MPRTRLAVVAACFFLSGAAGLVYEVVWSRYLQLIFGSTTYSITTVVATYMAGLGAGSLLFGRIVDRTARPARLYALLELSIAAYALLTPLLLQGVSKAFLGLHHVLAPTAYQGALLKAVLAGLVLTVPTLLMGGTLPILARELEARGEATAHGAGRLYALNTLGAVVGSAVAGFFLVEHLGLLRSLLLAAAANALAGLLVLRVAGAPVEVATAAGGGGGFRALSREPAVRLAALLAFGAGLGSLTAEIVWSRVLALVIGSSTYAFTLVLVAFLLGIGLGAALALRLGLERLPLAGVAVTQLVAAVGVFAFAAVLEPAVRFLAWFQQNPLAGFGAVFAAKVLVVLGAVLPATLGMGASFPLVVAVAAQHRGRAGEEVGAVYAANTLGSILGAVFSGFALLAWLGSFVTLQLAALVHAAVAAAALARGWDGLGRRLRAALVAVLVLLGLGVGAARPWSAATLSSGAFLYARESARTQVELERFVRGGEHQVLFFREGLSAVIAVWKIGFSTVLKINGKTDAGTGADMETQVLVGLRPALAHPGPRSALIIGAGAGVTARAVAAYPGIESIDLLEIEPAVVAAGDYFLDANGEVYRDPRVRIIYEDGRNHLLTTRRQYDLIISEPSNPWLAGIANLFTAEFYDVVKARMAPGGVFLQWIQMYYLSDETVRRMAATLTASFPHTQLWRAGDADLMVLCSQEPLSFSRARAQALIDGAGSWRPELEYLLKLDQPEDLLAGLVLDRRGMEAHGQGAAILHDDPPELEFAAVRTLGDRRLLERVDADLLAARQAFPPQVTVAEGVAPGFDAYAEGRLRLGWRRLPAAIQAFEAAVAARPDDAVRWAWLGQAQLDAGRSAEARRSLTQALALRPDFQRVRIRLAELAAGDGRLSEAAELLGGLPAEQRTARAWVVEAEIATRAGDVALALERVAEAARRMPPEPEAGRIVSGILSVVLAVGGRAEWREPTLAFLAAEAGRNPQFLPWQQAAARLLEQGGEPQRALAHYDRILSTGPDLAAFAGRARCLDRLGRREEARQAAERGLAYDPAFSELVAVALSLEGRVPAP